MVTLYDENFQIERIVNLIQHGESYIGWLEVSKVSKLLGLREKCIIYKNNMLFLSVGCQGTSPNAKSDALGTKVLPVAGLAVDLSLPLAELAAVHPLVADVAGEAGLVPGLPGRPHQLSNEDGLLAPRADLGPAPLGFVFHSTAHLPLREGDPVTRAVLC